MQLLALAAIFFPNRSFAILFHPFGRILILSTGRSVSVSAAHLHFHLDGQLTSPRGRAAAAASQLQVRVINFLAPPNFPLRLPLGDVPVPYSKVNQNVEARRPLPSLTLLLVTTVFSLALSLAALLPKRPFLTPPLPLLLLLRPLLGRMRQALELGRGGEDDL